MTEDARRLLDEALAGARAGQREAFGALVREHQRAIYNLALRMLNRADLAEDLTQDVFLQLHCKLDSIESTQHLDFWLRRVATNMAIDRLRRAPLLATQPLSEAIEPAVETPPGDHDPLLSRQLHRLLGELPPDPRAVMLLRYQDDRDVSEIAAILQMPVNTVKSHLKRSLTTLRTKLIDGRMSPSEAMP